MPKLTRKQKEDIKIMKSMIDDTIDKAAHTLILRWNLYTSDIIPKKRSRNKRKKLG